ncbi:hypothetical protein OBV_p-00380 (plasmid) [Oscillibacter valericigenes Sjm18-20]|nr:hypothetical protein OBV_p-00380 [Oscillibacter valericigenes Sjm18-20]
MYILTHRKEQAIFKKGQTYQEVQPTYFALGEPAGNSAFALDENAVLVFRQLENGESVYYEDAEMYYIADMGSKDHSGKLCICLYQLKSLAEANAAIRSYQKGIGMIQKLKEKEKKKEMGA